MKPAAIFALFCVLVCALTLSPSRAGQSDYDKLKTEAEILYGEKSFSRANELYARAKSLPLAAAEARWVAFRLADTQWRAQAATQTADSTKYDEARQQLEALIRDIQRDEDRDPVWAEAQESLGDFWWMRRDTRSWHPAWQFYQQALDYWAGSSQLEAARARYLQIVWKTSRPSWAEEDYYYGYYGNYVPLNVLQNALTIARTEEDRAHAHYLIAMTLRQQGDWEQRRRVGEEFEAALALGRASEWHDDALYFYGETLANMGRVTQDERGNWRQELDYRKSLELFRRLLSEYKKGETRYYDQAKAQIDNITRPLVNVGVSNIFLPDSEIQFHLNWRNVRRVEFALYKVDLTRDVRLSERDDGVANWLHRLAGGERVRAWTKETADAGDHKPGGEIIRLDAAAGRLPAGAYLLEARSEGATARDLILVSDVSLIVKSTHKRAAVYFCNVNDGSPVAGADIKVWERHYDGSRYVWREHAQ